MFSHLKKMLKRNRLTHMLVKQTRGFFLPHYHLPDLAEAWNREYYWGTSLDRCFDLYRQHRDYQAKLAARTEQESELPKKYLGPEWVSNIGTLHGSSRRLCEDR